jgi:hypothetical protein
MKAEVGGSLDVRQTVLVVSVDSERKGRCIYDRGRGNEVDE